MYVKLSLTLFVMMPLGPPAKSPRTKGVIRFVMLPPTIMIMTMVTIITTSTREIAAGGVIRIEIIKIETRIKSSK